MTLHGTVPLDDSRDHYAVKMWNWPPEWIECKCGTLFHRDSCIEDMKRHMDELNKPPAPPA